MSNTQVPTDDDDAVTLSVTVTLTRGGRGSETTVVGSDGYEYELEGEQRLSVEPYPYCTGTVLVEYIATVAGWVIADTVLFKVPWTGQTCSRDTIIELMSWKSIALATKPSRRRSKTK